MRKLDFSYTSFTNEAGCDEAGRGCLAGPVVAAAVILSEDNIIEGLDDSKKLNHKKRLILREEIIKKAKYYAIAFVDNEEIDKINILNASILAMHKALNQLDITPNHIIVDGNKFKPFKDIPFDCIVKGDSKYMNIAAASILAKTSRDIYMENIHKEFPYYKWNQNKGYPTMEHKLAIYEYGLSKFHRKTFSYSIQLKMF